MFGEAALWPSLHIESVEPRTDIYSSVSDLVPIGFAHFLLDCADA
jgi:hypothetical protein